MLGASSTSAATRGGEHEQVVWIANCTKCSVP